MSYGIADLIARFTAIWGESKTADGDTLLGEYERILKGVRADVLQLTGDLCIDNETFWPRPAEVRKHLTTAHARLNKYIPPEHREFAEQPPVDPEMRARVGALMKQFVKTIAHAQDAPDAKPNYWRDVTKPAFEEMQRNSKNVGLHQIRNPAGRDA